MEKFWKAVLSLLPCLVCRRFVPTGVEPDLHHVAPGSSERPLWAMVPICAPHHTGPNGFHSAPRSFLAAFRVPFEHELGLLVWLIEDLARLLFLRCRWLGKQEVR